MLGNKMSKELVDYSIRTQILLERYKQGLLREISPDLIRLASRVKGMILEMEVDGNTQSIIRQINEEIENTLATIKDKYEDHMWILVPLLLRKDREAIAPESESVVFEEDSHSIFPLVLGATWLAQWNKIIIDTKFNIGSNIRRMRENNQSISQIANFVGGTKTRKFKDGILNRHFNHLFAFLVTAIQSVVSNARNRVMRVTGVRRYRWVSVLDNRTTPICRGLSNKVFVVGEGPLPPQHYACRSTTVPYESGDVIPPSYTDWLRDQPKEVVEDVLGKTKADIFLNSDVSLDKFTANGRELTINELRQRLNN
jgi:SPP1 gp7 family putative phage head morphogenesis protein